MMSRRRRHHHHKPPSSSNPITTNRLPHTGTATEQDPPVLHLHPNVIARLMGMDDDAIIVPTTPPAPKPVATGTVHVHFVQPQQRRRHTNKSSLHLPYSYYYYSYRGRGRNADADPDDGAQYSSPSSRLCLNTPPTTTRAVHGSRCRPRQPRRHPQEEELLQKMRQDLQAWQASKAPPALLSQTTSSCCTRPSSDPDGGGGRSSSLVLQAIAQEDLRRQKMARYGLGLGFGHGKVTRQEELQLNKNKKSVVAVPQGVTSEHAAAVSEPVPMPHAKDLQPCKDGHGHGHGHTPIVLLKPATTCSESDTTTTGGVAIGGDQKTSVFLGLPKLHRDANMSMLLQEVKDRVQRELTVTAATATGGGGELIKTKQAPASAPPLQQVITKQDCGNKRRLFRSESFRALRRDRKRNASPEAYILKRQTMESSPKKAGDEESVADLSLSVLRPGGVVGVTDGQSFRSECLNLTKHRDDDDATAASSPRLLFRSFSAPEPGFALSLGRLFSFKQHQASDEPAAAADTVRMTSKSVVSAGFSSFIRGTVSSLRRHGFSSRRNLIMFRRKTHWSWYNKTASLGAGEIHPAKMDMPICATTTHPPSHETFNLFKVAQASLSELPPSPVSPLEVAAGHSSRHFFTDLHFTLPPELSPKCLSEFEAPATASESSFRTDITAVETAWSRDKAYITELLIAAGLYDDADADGPSWANARVDSMARPMPICDDVFEDVEDMYYYRGDYIVGMYGDGTDHRVLFDLANEALQSLVVESSSSRGSGASSLRQWVVDSTVMVSRGKKLVDDVWHKMQALKNHPQAQEMQTIDGMAAYEVRRSVWAEVPYEDVYVVGRKIERAIFDELIQDLIAALEVPI